MILYELKCSSGHHFEAWFKDSSAYDRQEKRGEIECPICSDILISKAPMAPAVSTSRKKEEQTLDPSTGSEQRAKDVARKILHAAGKVQKYVEENCEYVGDKFADEARAIHYGESEERGIYGEASNKDTIDLMEEEIPISRIPWRQRRDS